MVSPETTQSRRHPLSRPTGLSGTTEASPSLTTATAVAFVAALALVLAAPAFMQLQADSFRDLFLGKWILEHGIPHHEAIAIVNRGRPWLDQQWLSDLVTYECWKVAGYAGLALLSACAFAAKSRY